MPKGHGAPLFPSPSLLSPALPSLPLPSLPFLSLPSRLYPAPPFPFSPLEVGPKIKLGGLGNAVSSPSGVWGKAPADKRFDAYLSQKGQLWWQQFFVEFFARIYVIFIIFCTKIIFKNCVQNYHTGFMLIMLSFRLFWTFWKSVSYIKYLTTSLCQNKTKYEENQ